MLQAKVFFKQVRLNCFFEKIITSNCSYFRERNVFHKLGAATWNDLSPSHSFLGLNQSCL